MNECTDSELTDFCVEHFHTKIRARFLRQHDTVIQQIVYRTQFLVTQCPIKQRFWHIIHNMYVIPLCNQCNTSPVKWIKGTKQYTTFCSTKCSGLNPDGIAKRKKTNTLRYGVEWGSQNAQVKQKQKDTCLDRYGTEFAAGSDIVRDRIRDTVTDRYGVSSVWAVPEIQHKNRQTIQNRYGVTYGKQIGIPDDVLAKLSDIEFMKHQHYTLKKPYCMIAEELGVSTTAVACRMKYQHKLLAKSFRISKAQYQIDQYIQSLGIDTVSNDRTQLDNGELDIWIPTHNVAVEVNGVHWHSELNGRDRSYHRNKLSECTQRAIRLIQVLDIEWNTKRGVVCSRLRNILGLLNTDDVVYGRQCDIVRVDSVDIQRAMLELSHTQGYVASAVAYGLYHEGQLVAMMTFGRPRFTTHYQWELLRFCSSPNIRVIGGASKLLKRFISEYVPESIISYCDLRWGIGQLYSQLGFDLSHVSDPNFYYFKQSDSTKLMHRVQFQKCKMAQIDGFTFDPSQSGWINMINNGYDRIWDCGNQVWVLNIKGNV